MEIVKNVKSILDKYGKHANTGSKLVLLYLKEFHNVRWDNKYISTQDIVSLNMNLIQNIIDAKYLLILLEEVRK